jgi:hypothetical protein
MSKRPPNDASTSPLSRLFQPLQELGDKRKERVENINSSVTPYSMVPKIFHYDFCSIYRVPRRIFGPKTEKIATGCLYNSSIIPVPVTSYPIGIGIDFPLVKRLWCSAEVKKTWIFTSTPPHAFMA